MPSLLTLPIHDVLPATPRSRIVRLALDDRAFPFEAGQAVKAGAHGSGVGKPYSIACAPETVAARGWIELLMQVEREDSVGAHLPRLGVGEQVDVEGPFGTFTCPRRPTEHRFLFVAGGTGIAPLRAMIQHVTALGRNDEIAVLYSARSPDEFAFHDELVAEAEAGRLRVSFTVTRDDGTPWRGGRGRIGRGHLEGLITGPETLCFLCGPPALVDEVAPLLGELGIAPGRIRTDQRATSKTETGDSLATSP